MTTTTNDQRAMVEIIPVVLNDSDEVVTKGVPMLLTLEELAERLEPLITALQTP